MTRCRMLLLLFIVAPVALAQTTFPSYYSGADLTLAAPGSLRYGLYGFDNPALLSTMRQPDITFAWADYSGGIISRWGLFAAVPHLSFGMMRTNETTVFTSPADGGTSGFHTRGTAYDYQITSSFGGRGFSGGLGFGWSSGDREGMHANNWLRLGFLSRPMRYLSVGLTGTQALGGNTWEAVAEVGVRPLGTEALTLFGDASFMDGLSAADGYWSAGAAAEVLPGIRLTGRYLPGISGDRYRPSSSFNIGLEVSLGNVGASVQTNVGSGDDESYSYNTYAVRLGAYDRTVLSKLKQDRFAEMDLNGRLKYRRFLWFDGSRTLAGVLEQIENARRDDGVSGLVLNLSGMEAGRNMLWEVREKLAEFKRSGKKVVVYLDRAGMDEYHFASVADRIVMDPIGVMTLEGYLLGRTFLKGTLDKLGIGFDEWRHFTYKSANEALSRESMSAPDREQRQALVDEYYNVARREICAARNLTPAQFDSLVNERTIFTARDALSLGLVDSLGRWDRKKDYLASVEGRDVRTVAASSLEWGKRPYDDRWGEPPTIALIYALGVCDMDEGIRARTLAADVRSAVEDDDVRAIVLRVDSPGGDGLASDYVAEALRKARGKKPVIVSQGSVAASGGYWLSMYGDTIVAAPTTITGSIGVAGGWMYNTDLKQKLGMTTDHVRVGKHADLGFGFTMPLLGLGIPDRNLTTEERSAVEALMRYHYADFVGKVAAGRGMSPDSVERIAQGRVWTGRDALDRGLIDVLGGMETAIGIARAGAGIDAADEVRIDVSPEPGLFDFSSLMPRLLGTSEEQEPDPLIEQVRFRLKHNGVPMPVMPLEEMEYTFE